jgi:hypothetical protein
MIHTSRTLMTTAAAVMVLAGAAAAQKMEVKTHQDEKADFAAIRTYAWLPPAKAIQNVPEEYSNPTLSQEALGPSIVAAVDRELTARGLVQADRETADVHVVYFAALTTGFSQSFLGEHYGYITGWGSPIPQGLAPSTSLTAVEKGTVLVDIVHRASKRAIWRGTAVTRIDQELTLEKRVQRINEATARMFQRFPVASKK